MAPQQVAIATIFFVVSFPVSFFLNGKDKKASDYETIDKVALWLTPFASAFISGVVAHSYPLIGFLLGLGYCIIFYIVFAARRIWV
jgi:hypothetical protein